MLISVSYMGLAYNLAFLFSSAQHFAVNLFFISSFFSNSSLQMGPKCQIFHSIYIEQTEERKHMKIFK